MAFIERMEGQNNIDESRRYLDYLEEHLENVRRAFNELSKICDGMWWVNDDMSWHTLRRQVELHDLSKFSKEEFVQYRQSFYPTDSEDHLSNENIKLFDLAWDNHKRCNQHHHETLKNRLDVVHMVIDWTAMGYKFGDTAQEYYEKHQHEINISEANKITMYEIFDKIKETNQTHSA